MIPIAAYYLGATPSAPMTAPAFTRPQSMSQVSLPRSPTSPAPNAGRSAANRSSMPPASRPTQSPPGPSIPRGQLSNSEQASRPTNNLGPTPEESHEDTEEVDLQRRESNSSTESRHKAKAGSMNRDFKFPSPAIPNQEFKQPTVPGSPPGSAKESPTTATQNKQVAPTVIAPSSIEVPPPPPIEKEHSITTSDEGDDDLGDTVDIPL